MSKILGYKFIKKLLKITLYVLVTISLLMTSLVLALQFASVQTFVAQRTAKFLSKELDAQVQLSGLYFRPFTTLTIHNFSIKDPQGQLIVSSKRLSSSFNLRGIFDQKIHLSEIRMQEGYVDFHLLEKSNNFAFLIDYFAPKKDKKENKKKPIELDIKKIQFINCHFKFQNERNRYQTEGINYSDVELTDFSTMIDGIQWDSTQARFSVHQLTFKEKSGFHLNELTAESAISSSSMEFKRLFLDINRSTLRDYLKLEYDSLQDFSDFLHKVKITADLTESSVDSKDIEFFAPTMQNVQFATRIKSASLEGTIANINASNVDISTLQQTRLQGNFNIVGLPDINRTVFTFKNIALATHPIEIERLVPELSNLQQFALPEQIEALQNILFKGNFVGLYNNFDVNGMWTTALGNIDTDAKIDFRNGFEYRGTARSPQFQLGEMIHSKDIGTSNIDLSFAGSNLNIEDMNLEFEGLVRQFSFKNNRIDDISINGQITEKKLLVGGVITDPDVQMDYAVTIDWNDISPRYQLDSKIEKLNLKKFALVARDSVIIHNTIVSTNLMGNTINDISGYLRADTIHLQTKSGNFSIDNFDFNAEANDEQRVLTLSSNVLDAELRGVIDLNTIVPYFESMAMQYAPAIGFDRRPFNDQNFNLNVAIKSFDPVSTFLDSTFILDDGAYIKANFSSDNYLGDFVFFSPNTTYRGMQLSNLTITENANVNALSLDLSAERLYLTDSIFVEQIKIENILANDSLDFKISVAEDSAENQLRLNGNIYFAHDKPAFIEFEKSEVIIDGSNWEIEAKDQVRVSRGKFYFKDFRIKQGDQHVAVNGIVSTDNEDQLSLDFNRFSLSALSAITQPLGIELRGDMNGQVVMKSALKSPQFNANITTSPIVYNSLPIGQMSFNANYIQGSDLMDISISLLDELNRGLDFRGQYNLSDKENALNLRGQIKDIELVLFYPFLKSIISDLQGKASGELTVKGSFHHPSISGKASFDHADFKVNYLNTSYAIHDQSSVVDNNVVMLRELTLQDEAGHSAVANGYLDLNKIVDPTMDIDIKTENFMVLNTTYKENNLYYGNAYATGAFKFQGRTSALNIDIKATSNANTVMTIPFDAAMTISDSDFIYFVEKDSSTAKRPESEFFLSGLSMNMDLEMTPDAEINLSTDIGTLKGTGAGQVSLKISSLGDFEMFGDYTVNSGKFHFTAQDFINKYFDIKEGGTIRWTGDPSDANIDLTAIYQQRANLGALYNAAGRSGQDERVLAQADMIISGTLNQPDISFDLNFPLTPYVKDELQAYLSDDNNVNQQALSLIVRRSFTAASSNGEFGREVNNTLLSAGTEIAFNQLNSIISQSLNLNFLDLNIRSLNDASASIRLFDDRLVLTGGISDMRNLQTTDLAFFSNRIATDAEINYRIRKDGSLMFRAYNRLNTRNILFTPTDDYINAVGLVYRQEFDTFQEFFKRLMSGGKKKNPGSTLPTPN